jgi:hypothetical protein
MIETAPRIAPPTPPPDRYSPGLRIELPQEKRFGDMREDQIFQNADQADLENQGQAARAEQGRAFRAGNDVSVPKWQRVAESKARGIMQEAEQKASQPTKYTIPKWRKQELKAGIASPQAAGPPPVGEDLTPLLEESLRRARLKREK